MKKKIAKRCGSSAHLQVPKADLGKTFMIIEESNFRGGNIMLKDVLSETELKQLRKKIEEYVKKRPNNFMAAIHKKNVKAMLKRLEKVTREEYNFIEPFLSEEMKRKMKV